jgi:hypothetical protein
VSSVKANAHVRTKEEFNDLAFIKEMQEVEEDMARVLMKMK